MTKPFEYQLLANRTCPKAEQHRYDLLPLEHFKTRMIEASDALTVLDSFKRAFAYGKPTVFGDVHPPLAEQDPKVTLLLHMILGIVTEAGELLEAIMDVIFDGKPLDEVNIQEELGDINWYRVNALLAVGQTPDENDRQNIAKLLARFPDKFDADLAINRDTDAERAVLETGSGVLGLRDQGPEGRVDEEIRIHDAVIFAYGPDHDRVRGKDVLGDAVITGRLDLQPFVAGDEYDGKYRGMLLTTDGVHIYRLTGEVRDER